MPVSRQLPRSARTGVGGRGPRDDGRDAASPGRVRGTNLIILVLVVLAVGGAAILLARTINVAQQIDTKAQNIAKNGGGINLDTDSIVQLNRTNALATSILRSAEPLQGVLAPVVNRAQSINRLAGSINGRARTINSTAGTINSSARDINGIAASINSSAQSIDTSAGAINGSARTINGTAGAINGSARSINGIAGRINGTAKGINGSAGGIVGTAKLIDRDALRINNNLNATIALARSIKVDTGNILNQAGSALDTAACIDKKLVGGNGDPADCRGTP